MGAAAYDAEPGLLEVAELIFKIEERIFDSEGRRGGGSWKQDSPDWLARKIRMGLDPRINHATLALRKSMTVPDADHQILEVGPHHLRIGSDLPYAAVSQRNRPFVKFTTRDRLEMRNIIKHYLVEAWKVGAFA